MSIHHSPTPIPVIRSSLGLPPPLRRIPPQALDPTLEEGSFMAGRVEALQRGLHRQEAAALAAWGGNHFFVEHPHSAPLRSALAVWASPPTTSV